MLKQLPKAHLRATLHMSGIGRLAALGAGLALMPGLASGQAPSDGTASAELASVGTAFTPGTAFRDCENCPEMVILPAGRYVRGSPASEAGRQADEGPQREVTIGHPFAVGKYEVTWAQWEACVADGACETGQQAALGGDEGWGRGKYPVINVSRHDARAYADWLSARTGKRYRLLSEAEWEYAARAGSRAAYSWGSEAPVCDSGQPNSARFDDDEACDDIGPAPVGASAANGFGLHDLHGNVYEWTADCYAASYASVPVDGAPMAGGACESGVFRGGSWGSEPQLLRSAFRFKSAPSARGDYLGFRVARELFMFDRLPARLTLPPEVREAPGRAEMIEEPASAG